MKSDGPSTRSTLIGGTILFPTPLPDFLVEAEFKGLFEETVALRPEDNLASSESDIGE
jgi:hypothetical protein